MLAQVRPSDFLGSAYTEPQLLARDHHFDGTAVCCLGKHVIGVKHLVQLEVMSGELSGVDLVGLNEPEESWR